MNCFTKHIYYINSIHCKHYKLTRNKPINKFANCNKVHLPEREYNFLKEYFKERLNK